MPHFMSSSRRYPQPLLRSEVGLLIGAAVLLVLAFSGPVLSASAHQHAFADQRGAWGVPHLLDVLSNVPFALAGTWGLWLLRSMPPRVLEGSTRALVVLFCAGLWCTALGSTAYHGSPNDATLLWDRLGMVLPFAGLMGLAAGSRVSERAGCVTAGVVMVSGVLAVWWWSHTGNLLPWAVVQFGGMAGVLALAGLRPRGGALAVHLLAVIGWYAAAKVFEAADHAVFEATSEGVSGHSIKHLLAACAAWPVLSSLAARRYSAATDTPQAMAGGQNGGHSGRDPYRSGV